MNGVIGLAVLGFTVLGFTAWCLFSKKGSRKRVTFHGHGDTRRRAMNHELRHKRVLDGLKIRVASIRVWEEPGGWAGITEIDKSPANLRRWNALTPAEQAAVYMAGPMGPGGIKKQYCQDDLARVDERTSRAKARRIAQKYL